MDSQHLGGVAGTSDQGHLGTGRTGGTVVNPSVGRTGTASGQLSNI